MSYNSKLEANTESTTINEVDLKEEEQEVPLNWPSDIKFLSDHIYTPAALEQRPKLGRGSSDDSSWLKIAANEIYRISPNVQIRIINNDKHPANGQRGLFASQHLKPDQFILLYMGEVHLNSLSDTDPHSDYDLNLDRELGLSVDASRCGNESRHANDYRSIAERPNAEFRDCFIQVKSAKRTDGTRWERRVGIFVLPAGKAGLRKGGIKAGEEILVNYGKGFWEGRKLLGSFRNDAEMVRIAKIALEF
jgi:hypothetical protein